MLNKDQKVKFVEGHKNELSKYNLVGIIQLSNIPDRLLQSTKNKLKPEVKFIIGRKTLLKRILESSDRTKSLSKELDKTSAIILSNEDPFELFKKFKANSLKLAAKPNQVAPEDVNVTGGETSIQPGQAVTDLKTAGIDVQIQKGKVVIAKDKTIVEKGGVITPAIAKALHTLDIKPFTAVLEPAFILSSGILFNRELLNISKEKTMNEIALAFNRAFTLSLEAGVINSYTIKTLIAKAYRNAIHVGVETKIYDSGIIERLLAEAASRASALDNLKK